MKKSTKEIQFRIHRFHCRCLLFLMQIEVTTNSWIEHSHSCLSWRNHWNNPRSLWWMKNSLSNGIVEPRNDIPKCLIEVHILYFLLLYIVESHKSNMAEMELAWSLIRIFLYNSTIAIRMKRETYVPIFEIAKIRFHSRLNIILTQIIE